jgi:hypothetical protein
VGTGSGSITVSVFVIDTNPLVYIYNSQLLYANNSTASLAQPSRLANSSSQIRFEIQESPSTTLISVSITGGGTMSNVNNGYNITPNNNNPFDPITITYNIRDGWYGNFDFEITEGIFPGGSVTVNVFVMNTNPTVYIYYYETLQAGSHSRSLAKASRLVNSSSKIRFEIQENGFTYISNAFSINGGSFDDDPEYNVREITPNNNNNNNPITIYFEIDQNY